MDSMQRYIARAPIFISAVAVCTWSLPLMAAQLIFPPEPAPFLYFGQEIAADSDVAVIGAMGSEEAGPLTGSAFIARRNAAGTWSIEADLHPNPPLQLGQFSFSAAIDSDTVVIGATFISIEGIAYIYRRTSAGIWIQEAAITPPIMPHLVVRFGSVVAIRGDEAIIASAVDEIEQMWVFVYRRTSIGGWTLHQTLQPIGDNSLGIGSSLAIRGNRLIIGNVFSAAGTSNPTLNTAGAAYIFERNAAGEWQQIAMLTASDASEFSSFGSAVAIDGDVAVVGAAARFAGSVGLAGAIYTFERTSGGQWVEVDLLTHPVPVPNAQLGHHIDMRGGRMAVHSWVDVNGLNSGKAEVYRRFGLTWQLQDTFTATPPTQSDYFGTSAVLAGTELLYGVNTSDHSGRVEVVKLTPVMPGDLNCDGNVSLDDIEPFVTTVLDLDRPAPGCDIAADVDANGQIDGSDIAALIALMI